MNSNSTWPNLFVAGVPKGGTTALASILGQHPTVFVPEIKEPRYFAFMEQAMDNRDPINRHAVTKASDYLELFAESADARYRIDGSPSYFTVPDAISRIKENNSEAKFIVLLRDPIERAYSNFLFNQKLGIEPLDLGFEDVLERSEITLKSGFQFKRSYLEMGYYDDYLEHIYALFPEDQIFVNTSERFRKEQVTALEEILKFLSIDPYTFDLDLGEFAKSGLPKSLLLHRVINSVRCLKSLFPKLIVKKAKEIHRKVENRNIQKPELNESTRQDLISLYSPRMPKIASFGVQVSDWKNFREPVSKPLARG